MANNQESSNISEKSRNQENLADIAENEIIFESENEIENEASEETESEMENETEDETETDTENDTNDETEKKKAFSLKKIRAIHIAVAVLGVLIVVEYTFFGVFFHTNKKKYEKAVDAAAAANENAEDAEDKVKVVTEEPLPTTNVHDDATSTTAEATSEYITYDSTTASSTESYSPATEDETPVVTTESTTEATTESTAESTTEATTESTTESTTEATTEKPTESTTENTTESTTETTKEPTTEVTEAPTEQTTEATEAPTTEQATEASANGDGSVNLPFIPTGQE